MDPRTLLDRFGRRPPPSPELASALVDLDRLGRDRPDLLGPASALSGLIRAAFARPDAPRVEAADLEAMAGAWAIGEPSFRARAPRLDGRALAVRARSMARMLAPINPDAEALERAIGSRRVDLGAWAAEVFSGRPEEVGHGAEAAGLAPKLAASILRMALLPALVGVSARLGAIRGEGVWDRGDCPHCGGRPLLAESRGLEQRIALRCGLCAADWPGERLRCPACGERDSRRLDYSYVDGEQDRSRLARCEACRYAWKVVSTLSPLSPPALLVADLATLHLDLIAEGL